MFETSCYCGNTRRHVSSRWQPRRLLQARVLTPLFDRRAGLIHVPVLQLTSALAASAAPLASEAPIKTVLRQYGSDRKYSRDTPLLVVSAEPPRSADVNSLAGDLARDGSALLLDRFVEIGKAMYHEANTASRSLLSAPSVDLAKVGRFAKADEAPPG